MTAKEESDKMRFEDWAWCVVGTVALLGFLSWIIWRYWGYVLPVFVISVLVYACYRIKGFAKMKKPCGRRACQEWLEENGEYELNDAICYRCGSEGPMCDWYAEQDDNEEE